jgi:hypothetical protein
MSKRMVKILEKLALRDYVIIAVIYLTFSAILDFHLSWIAVLLGMVIASALVIGTHYLFYKYDAYLFARVRSVQPPAWNVSINNVLVGTVPDSKYAGMLRTALHSRRLWIAQLLNLGNVAMTVVDKLIVFIPIASFWLVVALGIFDLSSLLEILKAEPSEIISGAQSLLKTAFLFSLLTFGIMLPIGFRFGFKNHYNGAINRMLREHFNTVAEGDIHLWRSVEDPMFSHWSRLGKQRIDTHDK